MKPVKRKLRKGLRVKAPDGAEVIELIGIRPTNTYEVSLALATVKPGEATLSHHHDFVELYLVIEGKGEVYVDGEIFKVARGDCVLIPKGAVHYAVNNGNKELKFWCICTPSFTEEKTYLWKPSHPP